MRKKLGIILSGSLAEGLIMRIADDNDHLCEQLKAGKFVSIVSERYSFFSLVTDILLEVANTDILLTPPNESEQFFLQVLLKKNMYATVRLRPMIALDHIKNKIVPVKTIPPHFTAVFEARAEDVAVVFGKESSDENSPYFFIGCPVDMDDVPVCVDLEKITERSNGVFGKTGTGKTFLTRLLLAGIISKKQAVCIIFDMHSEYGIQARKEGAGAEFVKGLKTLFPRQVALFSLDTEMIMRRAVPSDQLIRLSYRSITVEDIISLHDELNLHTTAYEAAYLIAAFYKDKWLITLLASGNRLKELAYEVGAHPESIAALYRKLKPMERLKCFDWQEQVSPQQDAVEQMIEYIDKGISIIVEFGQSASLFCYLLVTNIITRRLHQLYVQKTEQFLGSYQSQEPKKLMIVIEEAHKFLNPVTARQTIFGVIAREMRKYYVSLFIIDQRPSGIDPEILSQIGTKIVAQLHDDRDVQAVLIGTNMHYNLKSVLASLESKKQVLLFGHALPMPIVIEARNYDATFYKSLKQKDEEKEISVKALIDEMF